MEEGECGKEETKDWQTHASVKQTDMEGGASLMVWGGISGLYRTDLVVIQGNLNGVRYRDEILQQQVEPFMQNHPEVEMFQLDNTRPHTARSRVCTAFLANAGIVVTDWPAKSSDINSV